MDGLGQVYSQSLSLFNQHKNELYIYICIYTHARRTTIVFVFILLKSDNRQHGQVYQIISHHNYFLQRAQSAARAIAWKFS